MKQAGFKENTTIDKARGLIMQNKWHPRTEETKKATAELLAIFSHNNSGEVKVVKLNKNIKHTDEESQWFESQCGIIDSDSDESDDDDNGYNESSESGCDESGGKLDEASYHKIVEWGGVCGVLKYPLITPEQLVWYKNRKVELENELKATYDIDVSKWNLMEEF